MKMTEIDIGGCISFAVIGAIALVHNICQQQERCQFHSRNMWKRCPPRQAYVVNNWLNLFWLFLCFCAVRLSWPSRQLLNARWSTVSYRTVSYRMTSLSPATKHTKMIFKQKLNTCLFGQWRTSYIQYHTKKSPRGKHTGRESVHVKQISFPHHDEVSVVRLGYPRWRGHISETKRLSPFRWRRRSGAIGDVRMFGWARSVGAVEMQILTAGRVYRTTKIEDYRIHYHHC